ncbi:MAG: glycoside hydrolase family 3 C-terminal domain-containing protein [Candidatus Helarchaeota archaeon]
MTNIKELSNLPFMNPELDLEKRVDDLLSRLSLEEKFKIIVGKMLFFTRKINRLGIKSFKMTDGPNGVGALGTFFLKKTTYFPVAICRASTWNLDLSRQFGEALAEEARAANRHMMLAPAINIQRTPLCGRNFEYQTEDPYLNSKLTVAVVQGIQSKRIAACIKHYVANNQEKWRFNVSAEIDDRTLREIYLPAFESAVKEADAWSVMACYNKINGIHGCEHRKLLKEILMDEFGFKGFVVSDWTATKHTSVEGCMNAGLSLEMPFRLVYKHKKLREALDNGLFTEETLNENIRRLLRVMFLVGMFDPPEKIPKGSLNSPEHIEIAKKIASEGIVLLKNSKNLLPLDINKIKTIAVIGPNANKKMAFGGGSSMIRAKYEITPLKGIKNKCADKIKLVNSAKDADIAVVVVGLNHKSHMDCENTDRKSFELPKKHIEIIKKTAEINPNTIVVLVNGSPVSMDEWINDVPAIIEAWYAGQEAGNVIADIIFGDINPSGKLPITFPRKLSDSPAHKSERTYPGIEEIITNEKGKKEIIRKVFYEEGIFVGYRYFDKNNIEPLFPFGFGLSYTNFDYSNLKIDKNIMQTNDSVKITVDIKNTGDRYGAEIVQLYVQDVESSVERPIKELKGFTKLYLNPGEKKTAEFVITEQDLSYYDINSQSWKVEEGTFKILIGASSRDIKLEGQLEYKK